MMKKDLLLWPQAKDGQIALGSKTYRLPGLRVTKELGRGANAAVFEAVDEVLERHVAVKVWNQRGERRAQSEASKIAGLNHALIVNTYYFQSIDDRPYSVMELVPGVSGKQWIKEARSFADRVHFWELYSRAMEFIHSLGQIHGDPHLGNVLVLPDPDSTFSRSATSVKNPFTIKLADAGTSRFWDSREGIERREAELIFETFGRVFSDVNLAKLWHHPSTATHRQTLDLLRDLCKYVSYTRDFIDYDRKAENADRLVAIVTATPLFDLDEIQAQVAETSVTTVERFARRLNSKLLGIPQVLDAEDAIEKTTRQTYARLRDSFLKTLSEGSR